MVNVEFILFAILRSLSPKKIVHFIILLHLAGQNGEELVGGDFCEAADLEGRFIAREKIGTAVSYPRIASLGINV